MFRSHAVFQTGYQSYLWMIILVVGHGTCNLLGSLKTKHNINQRCFIACQKNIINVFTTQRNAVSTRFLHTHGPHIIHPTHFLPFLLYCFLFSLSFYGNSSNETFDRNVKGFLLMPSGWHFKNHKENKSGFNILFCIPWLEGVEVLNYFSILLMSEAIIKNIIYSGTSL